MKFVLSAALLMAVSVSQVAFAAAVKNAAPALKVGDAAPDFSAQGSDGKTYKLSELKGKTVVLEWYNKDCPYVRKFYDAKKMQDFQREVTGNGVVWLSVASSAPGKEGFLDSAAATKTRTDSGMGSTALLLDADGKMATAYSAKTTPHMFVIDKKGLIAYQGAIDDRPSANPKSLDGAQNYVKAALLSLDKGEPVKTASTAPYGCSVKY